MGYAWSLKYKVLNISVETSIGESQADHWKIKQLSNSDSCFFRLKHYIFTLVHNISQDSLSFIWKKKSLSLMSISTFTLFQKLLSRDWNTKFPYTWKSGLFAYQSRRWEAPTTQTYIRDWTLVASDTHITAEFEAFLKELLRQSCR